jgi:hypothetical protein
MFKKSFYVVGTVVAIALCVGVSLIPQNKSSLLVSAESKAGSQAGMRTLSIVPRWNESDPAKLVNVTLDNQQILSKTPFQASDTWLRDLKFTVENISQKSVRQVLIRINIPVDGKPYDAIAHEISIGKDYFSYPNPIDNTDEVLIQPGRSIEMQFNSSKPTNYQSFLSRCQQTNAETSQITRAEVYLLAVVFEETKTCWYKGKMMNRISENEWKVVGEKISRNQKTPKVIKASFAPTRQQCASFEGTRRVDCTDFSCAPSQCSARADILIPLAPGFFVGNFPAFCSLDGGGGGDCGCTQIVQETTATPC